MPQRVAAQVGARVHRLPTGRLDLQQLERPGAAPEQQPAVSRREHPRGEVVLIAGPDTQHADRLPSPNPDPCADVRMQRAHPALQLDRRPDRIEQAVLGSDLLGVGDPLLRLLVERRPLVESAHEQLAASSCRRAASVP